jgi:hypothetical protein
MSENKYQILDEYPNVFILLTDVTLRDQNIMSKLHMDKFMGDLILPIAKQFPKWEFHGYHLRSYNNGLASEKYYAHRWEVYCDGEDLGQIGRDYYGSKLCYTIANHRIADKRERGYADKTTKLDKAKKLVFKNFKPKDIQELMYDARARVDSNVAHAGYMAESEWRRPYVDMMNFLSEYMMNKFDELSKEAVNLGMSPTKIPKIKDAWDMLVIKQGVSECHKQKAGAVVLIHGSTYVVGSDKGQTFTCESATLPVSVKRKVGMLKLLEDDNYLIDVGYRQNENTFYICNYMETH